MSATLITDLSSDLTSRILTQAGAWEIVGGYWVCAWNVCRAWRDHLRAELPLAKLLVEVHGERAVARAAGCTSMAVDRSDVLVAVLQQPGMRANYQDGWALVVAAHHGHMDAMLLLLERGSDAPRADCWDGDALVVAAYRGHEDIVRLLLDWREHAPYPDTQSGRAFMHAELAGHKSIINYVASRRSSSVSILRLHTCSYRRPHTFYFASSYPISILLLPERIFIICEQFLVESGTQALMHSRAGSIGAMRGGYAAPTLGGLASPAGASLQPQQSLCASLPAPVV